MRKLLAALSMTLVAGTALLSAPADAGAKTVSDCRAESLACSKNCPAVDTLPARACRGGCRATLRQCYVGLGGRPTKVPGGGGVVVPKQPGGGVVAQPKWSPKSPPIGIYQPRPPFSAAGPVGPYHPRHDWHSGGSPQGGPILLRSGGRR
jgi:hypothetical protein